MADSLFAWKAFLAVYETRSIQAAAKRLNSDPSVISRQIGFLEKKKGSKLFDRGKRPFKPTSDAHSIVTYVRNMIYQSERIERYYFDKQDGGQLIIKVMIGNTTRRFAPALLENYLAKVPSLRFNMISPIDVTDFLMGKADVLGSGTGRTELPNCQMLSRGMMVYVPVASPEYIKEHGKIENPEDLKNHQVFKNLYHGRYTFHNEFPLMKKGRFSSFNGIERIRWANADIVKEAVMQGYGVGISLPLFSCIEELESGKLVPILDGWHRPSEPNFVACTEENWKIKHIRLFAAYWAKEFSHYEEQCETRLARLYGSAFVNNLREGI